MSQLEHFVRGRFRAAYKVFEQQPDSVRVGGSDYALEITRGAELSDARSVAPYLATTLLDEHTFQAVVVPQARVSFAAGGEARMATLYNVLVQQVQLREVVYHGNAVYGILEGEAFATLGRAEDVTILTEPLSPPRAARGLWRLGCLLPLLTLGVGGCLVSQGLWLDWRNPLLAALTSSALATTTTLGKPLPRAFRWVCSPPK